MVLKLLYTRRPARLFLAVALLTGLLLAWCWPSSLPAGDFCGPTRQLERQWGKPHKLAAIEGGVYALLAHNAYSAADVSHFRLPDSWRQVEQGESPDSGLAWQLYEQYVDGRLVRVALALRGSDDWRDWLYGTFSGRQYEEVSSLIPRLQARYAGIPMVATGHSLGGGLALHAAMWFDNVSAYAFNPSPLVHAPETPRRNRRVVYWEDRDLLHWGRAAWHKAPQTTYWRFAFAPEDGHDSNALAHGLLALAASLNDSFAALRQQNCHAENAS